MIALAAIAPPLVNGHTTFSTQLDLIANLLIGSSLRSMLEAKAFFGVMASGFRKQSHDHRLSLSTQR